jgi:hypothetical protein
MISAPSRVLSLLYTVHVLPHVLYVISCFELTRLCDYTLCNTQGMGAGGKQTNS